MALTAVLNDTSFLEQRELETLAYYAIKSGTAVRRGCTGTLPKGRPDFRTAFQHDRDRIIHSRAFRRLKQKTQVFMPDEGDHFRTRLSHTLEVSQLGRTLARTLGLNEDLVEAIALAHDVGHAPFGHSGEDSLHKIMSGEDRLDGALDDSIADREVVWEGFKHNHQSLRIVDMLEYKYVLPGLDLTDFVREGILRHTNIDARTGKRPLRYTDLDYSNLRLDQPLFLEGQVVALVDEVAQHSHDLEDGFRAQVVDLREVRAQVPLCARIAGALEQETGPSGNLKHLRNMLIHGIISFFMSDLREESVKRIQQWLEQLPAAGPFRRELLHTDLIAFSPAGRAAFESFSAFVINHVIKCQEVDRMDARAAVVIPQLFRAYLRNPRLLPDYLLDRFPTDKKVRLRGLSNQELDACSVQMKRDIRYLRNICDYIAGMTDSFAVKEFQMMTYPTAGK